jgi:hypothetical protein
MESGLGDGCGSSARFRHGPVTGRGLAHVKAGDGIGEVAHEVRAPQFPIGKDLKAKVFLAGEGTQNAFVFQGAQAMPVKNRVTPGFQKGCGAQKTAYVLSAKCKSHE